MLCDVGNENAISVRSHLISEGGSLLQVPGTTVHLPPVPIAIEKDLLLVSRTLASSGSTSRLANY